MKFFVSCPKGLEPLLQAELQELDINVTQLTMAGLFVEGDQKTALTMILWSRIANRVTLILEEGKVDDIDDVYELVKSVDWAIHMSATGTFSCQFHGKLKGITNSQFANLKVKDGVVDYFREERGMRPDVDRENPDILVTVAVKKGVASIGIDLAKGSLHRRGYRKGTGAAPMKENLAAAVLRRAGWHEMAKEGANMIDPMCGTGTLLIEAAMIAGKVAPGLLRQRNTPEGWNLFDRNLWMELVDEAREIRYENRENIPAMIGYDQSNKALAAAQRNIAAAGLDKVVKVYKRSVEEFVQPTHITLKPGLVISNPPYGVRLSEAPALARLYQTYAEKVVDELPEWTMALFTAEPDSCRSFPQKLQSKYQMFNGDLETQLMVFSPGRHYQTRANNQSILSEGAQMFANRILKNQKKLKSWLKQTGFDAYRLYDADLPEYNVAVDVYGEYIQVQEYAPPKSVDENKAQKRLRDVLMALPEALGIEGEKIVLKQRTRQSGKSQYEKRESQGEFFEIQEGDARYRVNLHDYLDTGVFLDHRWARKWLHSQAKGKRVLNLFCYTGTASVQAAKGFAKEVVSVDMSRTYLNWAKDNFRANFLTIKDHQFVQADCVSWLSENQHEKFDLIFMDPPTFSNSKRMEDVFDVQRDHQKLIDDAMNMLNPGGTLLFSNNYRKFKLDKEISENYTVEDVTDKSIPQDFGRNSKIHQCFLIKD